jgi:hypothetical protein
VLARHHEDEAVLAERKRFERARIDRGGDNAEVSGTFGDQPDDLVAQALLGSTLTWGCVAKWAQRLGQNSVSALVFDRTRICPASPPAWAPRSSRKRSGCAQDRAC